MPRINVKDKRKQQLIEANLRSIAKRGLTETTITHVSQGAGLSRGIVNFYFTSKEKMMQETLKFLAEEYTEIWKKADGRSHEKPLEHLKAVVRANFHASLCNSKRLTVWTTFWGHAGAHKPYSKILAKYDVHFHARLEDLWAQTLRASGFKTQLKGSFATELQAMIRGLWVHMLVAPDSMNRNQAISIAEQCIDQQLASLEAKRSPKAKLYSIAEGKKKKPKAKNGVSASDAKNQMTFDELLAANE